MCISFFVCFFLECFWSLFSKVCLYYLYGSLVSFFSVSHFLFCSWVWSVPCLCSPRPGSSFPLCLCVTSGCFVSCLPLFFSSLWTDCLSLSPLVRLTFYLFLILLFLLYLGFLFSTCPFCLSWAIYSLFSCSVCFCVSLFFVIFHFTSPFYSHFFSAFPLLLTFASFSLFMSLCLPLLDVLYSSLLAYFLCICVFAHVCMFVTKGLLSPF